MLEGLDSSMLGELPASPVRDGHYDETESSLIKRLSILVNALLEVNIEVISIVKHENGNLPPAADHASDQSLKVGCGC